MRLRDKYDFLVCLLAAATKFQELPRAQRTPDRAAAIARELGLTPKGKKIDNRSPIVTAIDFYGKVDIFHEQGIPLGILILSGKLKDEEAWREYSFNYADQMA